MNKLRPLLYIVAGFIGGYCMASYTSHSSLAVYDQTASDAVRISSLRLNKGGYVVVESRSGGGTRLVGMSDYLPKGEYVPLHVELFDERDRSAYQQGSEYRIVVHEDNGDKFYDAAHDLPMKTAAGRVIEKTIRII